MISLTYF